MAITYTTPKVISPAVHKHKYELIIENGKIVGYCYGCGKSIEYAEIIRRINADGLR